MLFRLLTNNNVDTSHLIHCYSLKIFHYLRMPEKYDYLGHDFFFQSAIIPSLLRPELVLDQARVQLKTIV